MISRAPCVRRVQNHFADAECVRQKRIAFTFGKSSHTRRLAHFHYGKLSIGDPGVTRVDLTPEADRAPCISPTNRQAHCK